MEEMQNEWLSVPGASKYRINVKTGRVWSDYINRFMNERLSYNIHMDDGEILSLRTARIIYAAKRGIDPRRTAVRGLFVIAAKNGPVLGTAHDVSANIQESRRDPERVKEQYKAAIDFSCAVLRAFNTGNWRDVAIKVEECHDRIVERLVHRGLSGGNPRNRVEIETVWAEVSERFLNSVKSGMKSPVCLEECLYYSAIRICNARKAQRRRLRQLTERNCFRGGVFL